MNKSVFSAFRKEICRLRGNQVKVLNDPVTVNREWNPALPLVEILRRLDFVWNCKSGNLLNSLMKASEESTSFS